MQATQPKAWDTLANNHGSKAADTLLDRVRTQLDQRGTLDVLRHGVELLGLKTPLTLAQLKDLGQRVERSGRKATELSMWIKLRYGVDSSAELTRRVFSEVAAAIEAPGSLPMQESEE